MRRNRVLIEFTSETKDPVTKEVLRSKGERVYVDPMSAESFTKKKKVAKVVDEKSVTADEKGDQDDSTPAGAGS